jgi:hypothetical protein
MHILPAPQLLSAAYRRRLVRAVRGALHTIALAAGVLSSGLVPAHLCSESNEAETQQRDSSTEYAQIHCDARLRSRRTSLQRGDALGLALSLPATLTDAIANRSSYSLSNSFATVRLSLGHSIPLRC